MAHPCDAQSEKAFVAQFTFDRSGADFKLPPLVFGPQANICAVWKHCHFRLARSNLRVHSYFGPHSFQTVSDEGSSVADRRMVLSGAGCRVNTRLRRDRTVCSHIAGLIRAMLSKQPNAAFAKFGRVMAVKSYSQGQNTSLNAPCLRTKGNATGGCRTRWRSSFASRHRRCSRLARKAGDITHGPRQPIHQPAVHAEPAGCGGEGLDGRSRSLDGQPSGIERLWRLQKCECVYLHASETGFEVRAGFGNHQAFALGGRAPIEARQGPYLKAEA